MCSSGVLRHRRERLRSRSQRRRYRQPSRLPGPLSRRHPRIPVRCLMLPVKTVQTPGFGIPSAKDTANHTSDTRAAYSPQDRSAEAARLWSAVGAGDSSAELELARLYLKGEGVLRNCEQAKILLRAAAKGGNWEARQQLQKLRANGDRKSTRLNSSHALLSR